MVDVQKATGVLRDLFGDHGWTFVPPTVDIYDAAGPLLFQDYCFEAGGRHAWVRLIPGFTNRTVSVQEGQHPTRHSTLVSDKKPDLTFTLEAMPTSSRQWFGRLQTKITDRFEQIEAVPLSTDKIYCYHYPNLGILTQTKSGEPAFKDIMDGEEFTLREAGVNASEDRQAYSFLGQASEGGEPGPIVAPSPRQSIVGSLQGQEHDNWCAAASCEMLLSFYHVQQTQTEIAARMAIPADPNSGGADLQSQVNCYQQLLPQTVTVVKDENPLGQSCIDELANGRPLKVGIFKHAQACFGWATSGTDVLYEIYDPMPVGVGQKKLQNPAVVWSQNHIYIRPKEKSAEAGAAATTTSRVFQNITGDQKMATEPTPAPAAPPKSPLKQALAALVGMPVEAVIVQFGAQLKPAEADMLRKMTPDDIAHIKATDTMLSKALSESGGGNGCGAYY